MLIELTKSLAPLARIALAGLELVDVPMRFEDRGGGGPERLTVRGHVLAAAEQRLIHGIGGINRTFHEPDFGGTSHRPSRPEPADSWPGAIAAGNVLTSGGGASSPIRSLSLLPAHP